MQRILLIEDNPDLARNVVEFLESAYIVDVTIDGVSGLRTALRGEHAAVVLDLSLPRMDGLEVCRTLRAERGHTPPVLMLTARDTLEDTLEGFAAGADDYLVKPFALAELKVRIESLLRRCAPIPDAEDDDAAPLRCGDLELDLATYSARRAGVELRLQRIAMRILETLMRAAPAIVRRADLEQIVWNGQIVSESVVRTHVWGLRRALDPEGTLPALVHTVHGIGYRLGPLDDTSTRHAPSEP